MDRLLPMAALIVAGAVATATDLSDPPDVDQRVVSLLSSFRETYRFPGATMAYILPDGRAGTVAVGLADREAGTAMTPAHRMLAASIGKTLWAALVLSLEAESVMHRSDRVEDHLGHLPWYARLPNAKDMTIGQLLTHRAGLPDHVQMEGTARALIALGHLEEFEPEQAVAFVLDQTPLFEAGTGWAYSDTGYLLLGLAIEAATGQDVFDLARARFLTPLGLSRTGPSAAPRLEGLAVGYTAPNNPFGLPPRTMDAAGELTWNPAIEWTGGGFASTSEDLAIWGHALFTGAAMDAPYLERLLDAAPVGPGIFYGSGVAVYAGTSFGTVYGHAGWIPGYVSSLRHYADHRVTIAFQINSDVGVVDNSTDLVPALEAALAGLLLGDTLPR